MKHNYIHNQTCISRPKHFGQYLKRKVLSILSIILIVICAALFIYYIVIFPGFVDKDKQFVLEHLSINKDSAIGSLKDGRFLYQGTQVYESNSQCPAGRTRIINFLLEKSPQHNSIAFGSFLKFDNTEKYYISQLKEIASKVYSDNPDSIQMYLVDYSDQFDRYEINISKLLNAYINAVLVSVPNSAPLENIFNILSSCILVLYLIATILQAIVLRWLFKGTRNGDKIYKYIVGLCVTALIATFFLISLKPIQTQVVDGNITKTVVTEVSGVEITNEVTIPNTIKNPEVINYWGMWLSLALALVIVILCIQAKKKYGYLTNSTVLNQEMKDTTELSNKIETILNSSVDHTIDSPIKKEIDKLVNG
ncbi:hypothetical protein LNO75_01015 [Mycoplasma sp. T363T]|uniref:hypothetical protein n=1 Tax=Mycoplasma bradburyae TaxID=2963128 RepID=UPI00234124F2|nr:hypothetical protein [Mycoplasma bradburyae]MDC4163158.1 hypothetical protein [Mycoplasma bradburyae]